LLWLALVEQPFIRYYRAMPYKKRHDINLFGEPGSKLCELVKVYFRSSGNEYIELNVKRDKNAFSRMVEISGQDKTPVVEIDGRVIVGYRPELYDLILEGKSTDGQE
jgi:hypothetical protein